MAAPREVSSRVSGDARAAPVVVSVCLAVHDGLRWLPACLDSIDGQTQDGLEIVVLDDVSSDGSREWLRGRARRDPRIRLEEAATNLGYAAAQNRNIRRARSEAILLLNQDVVLDRGFLAAGLDVLRRHADVGSVQGRIRRLAPDGARRDLLDTTGLVMHLDRHASIRGHGQPDDGASVPHVAGPVWGVDGPAPLYRRAALRAAALPRRGGGVEVLDEDFFMHKEDVDLAWRLRRLGWRAWYEPAALAWHARTGSGSTAEVPTPRSVLAASRANAPAVRAMSWRNQRLMQVKNDPLRDVLRDLPWIVAREVAELAYIVLRDPGRLRVAPSLLRSLPWAMRKRIALDGRVRRQAAVGRPGLSS